MATITFDHAVKYNGKYYPANTPIEEAPEKAAEAPVEPVEVEAEETVEPKPEAAKKAAKTRKKGDA